MCGLEGGREGGMEEEVLISAFAAASRPISALLSACLRYVPPLPSLPSSSSRPTHTVVDLEAFGVRGLEPAAVSSLRNLMKDTEPALYKLILTDDKIAQKFMDDPSAAYREAQALSPALAEAARVLAAGGSRR